MKIEPTVAAAMRPSSDIRRRRRPRAARFGAGGKRQKNADKRKSRHHHPLNRSVALVGVVAGERFDPIMRKNGQDSGRPLSCYYDWISDPLDPPSTSPLQDEAW
jgi:hypothetical protein